MVLPPNYAELVGRIRSHVSERVSWSANCLFHPPLAAAVREARTAEVEEVQNGDVLTLTLADYLHIDGLEELCSHVIPEIERAIYGAYVLVDKVYVHRTLVSRYRPEQSSWTWHYDQHPLEVLKLLIYLTDVDSDSAPFTYLSRRGTAVMGTRNPLFGQSRIPASAMEAYARKGCRAQAVTGPSGTAVLFNDNVLHRATFAQKRHRDVLILQLRPTGQRRLPHVDARWTGSLAHRDFNRNPEQVEPRAWPPGAQV